MSVLNIHFSAVDSLLFKPALSPDGMGARLLASDFPPPRTTLVGALRSAIGEKLGAVWSEYRAGHQPEIDKAIGRADEPHPPQAAVAGPWLSHGGNKLVPLPLCFLAREEQEGRLQIAALTLTDTAFRTDLGSVRLPALPDTFSGQGFRGRDDIWVPASLLPELGRLLDSRASQTLERHQYFTRTDLFVWDDRLGIGMERGKRTVQDGMLYQTRHVRLREDVGLMLQVADWPEAEHAHDGMVTLGADGRLAHVTVEQSGDAWTQEPRGRALIVATAPVPMGTKGLPQILSEDAVIGAATSKPWRRGGWNLKQHRSKPVRHWVAPGSAFWTTGDRQLSLTPDFYCYEYQA